LLIIEDILREKHYQSLADFTEKAVKFLSDWPRSQNIGKKIPELIRSKRSHKVINERIATSFSSGACQQNVQLNLSASCVNASGKLR
jgi:hypothetical protein